MGIISQPRGLFPSYFSWISASLRASHACTLVEAGTALRVFFLRVLIWTTKRLWICALYCLVFMLWQTIVIPFTLQFRPPRLRPPNRQAHQVRLEVRTQMVLSGPGAHTHTHTYLLIVFPDWGAVKKVNISIGWYQGDSVPFSPNVYIKAITDPYNNCCLMSIICAI